MKIIECNSMTFNEKTFVNLKNEKDFEWILGDSCAFKFKNILHYFTGDLVFTYLVKQK